LSWPLKCRLSVVEFVVLVLFVFVVFVVCFPLTRFGTDNCWNCLLPFLFLVSPIKDTRRKGGCVYCGGLDKRNPQTRHGNRVNLHSMCKRITGKKNQMPIQIEIKTTNLATRWMKANTSKWQPQ